jgi:hypothetical protein
LRCFGSPGVIVGKVLAFRVNGQLRMCHSRQEPESGTGAILILWHRVPQLYGIRGIAIFLVLLWYLGNAPSVEPGTLPAYIAKLFGMSGQVSIYFCFKRLPNWRHPDQHQRTVGLPHQLL